VKARLRGSFVRHGVESAALVPAGVFSGTGHREDSFSPCDELPGTYTGANGVADE
jgi:hypothetical protein